jgi:hypothetical protein
MLPPDSGVRTLAVRLRLASPLLVTSSSVPQLRTAGFVLRSESGLTTALTAGTATSPLLAPIRGVSENQYLRIWGYWSPSVAFPQIGAKPSPVKARRTPPKECGSPLPMTVPVALGSARSGGGRATAGWQPSQTARLRRQQTGAILEDERWN